MSNDKVLVGGIIGIGILTTSIVIGAETPTYATMIEPKYYMNSVKSYERMLDDHNDYLGGTPFLSFKNDRIKIGIDIDEDDHFETEIMEVPVVKSMLFQFKRPIKLTFS
jgi:hypothetical protein